MHANTSALHATMLLSSMPPLLPRRRLAVSLTRQQVGVEALTVEFPLTPYRGFGSEAGYNGIYFWSTAHCWVKNVAIINADMAVTLDGTYFCTVRRETACACLQVLRARVPLHACSPANYAEAVPVRPSTTTTTTTAAATQIDNLQLSSGGRGINNGAWGVWLKNGADNIIKNFNAGSRLVRDIAVQGLQPGTVIANSELASAGGRHLVHRGACQKLPAPFACPWICMHTLRAGTGVDLCIETMNGGPYGLLLSNLHMGYGSRPWGQNALNVIDATSFNTFWNIRSNSKARAAPGTRLPACLPAA